MSVAELVTQIEALRADTTLAPEDKKKALKKLRRQIRKAGGSLRGQTTTREKVQRVKQVQQTKTTVDELYEKLQDWAQKAGFTEVKGAAGMGFSLALTVNDPDFTSIEDYFLKKYRQRWNREPSQIEFIRFPSDTILCLGPVNVQ